MHIITPVLAYLLFSFSSFPKITSKIKSIILCVISLTFPENFIQTRSVVFVSTKGDILQKILDTDGDPGHF